MTLLVGAPVRLESGLHIACFVIRPDQTVDLYTKHYLHDSEERYFRPFTLNPLIDFGDTAGAIAICADTNDPRHMMTTVLANYGGKSGGLEAAGGSAIWDSSGKAVANMEGTGTGLVIGIRRLIQSPTFS